MIAVVNIPTDEALRERFRASAPDITFYFEDYLKPGEHIGEADIAFGGFYRVSDIPKQNRLKWIQLSSSGADYILKANVLNEDTIITSSTGAYGVYIAEFMLGQILALNYKLHLYRDQQNECGFKRLKPVPSAIYGKRVLILGLGDIGGELAKRLKTCGAHIVGVRRSETKKHAYVDAQYAFSDAALNSEFEKADIVAMCMPGTKETQNFLSRERIALLKKTAIVVNVGRGSAIDEQALCEALKEERIAGAALDVFEKEPLASDSPLYKLRNLLFTPHIAGSDIAPEVIAQSIELFFENLAAFRANAPMKSVISRSRGYCAK